MSVKRVPQHTHSGAIRARGKIPLFSPTGLWHKPRLFSPEHPDMVDQQIIASRQLQVERKFLIIDYCENSRGRFLRICEEAHGRRNTVIVPSTGLDEFLKNLAEVAAAGGHELPQAE